MEALLTHALSKQAALQFLAHAIGTGIVVHAYALLVKVSKGGNPSELAPRNAPAALLAGFAIGLAMFSTVMAIVFGFDLYDEFRYHGVTSAWHGAGITIKIRRFGGSTTSGALYCA